MPPSESTSLAAPNASPRAAAARPACLVCGGVLDPSRIRGLLACRSCGFVTADLRLDPAELDALYREAYFRGEEYVDYEAEEGSLKANFRRRLAALRRHCPSAEDATLFEIGCAYGFFLDLAGDHFARVRGIDISSAAIEHAERRHGSAVTCGDYLRLTLPDRPDVIVMWDTIEHLGDPRLFIEKAWSDLKPGGLLAITTGDIGSVNARARGAKWRMIHPPTHLHYFSSATMSRLLTDIGFRVLEVSHPGNVRTLRAYLDGLLPGSLRARAGLHRMLDRRFFDVGLTLNLFDIMLVVGRRPAEDDETIPR